MVPILVGAGVGVISGYAWDRLIVRDEAYTPGEALTDATLGGIGGGIGAGVVKPMVSSGLTFTKNLVKVGVRHADELRDMSRLEKAEGLSHLAIASTRGHKATFGKGLVLTGVGKIVDTALDHYTKSPASSSQSYQQNGGAGGTVPTYATIDDVPKNAKWRKPSWVVTERHPVWDHKHKRKPVCRKGWTLVKVGGNYRCMIHPSGTPK